MKDDEHYRKLERMYGAAPMNEYFAPELEVEHGRARVSIRVQKKFFHAGGAVHGSLYFKALDDAAYFAAASLVLEYVILTVSFNIHLLRPVSSGVITATGRLAHASRRLLVADSRLVDSEGREIGRGSGSFFPSDMRLTEEIGYV